MVKEGIYTFILVRSGDGKEFKIGQGTLDEGRSLIHKMDSDFEKGRPVHDFFEGADIYAEQGGKPAYIFTSDWEAW